TAQNTLSTATPTERFYYDASGRLVASTNARGFLTRFVNLEGTGYEGGEALIKEMIDVGGNSVYTEYDVHGEARRITDQIGRITTQEFDVFGNMVMQNRAGFLQDSFVYDEFGRQLQRSYTFNAAPRYVRDTYDIEGRVIRNVTAGGDTKLYTYEWDGTSETTGLATVFGAWKKTTTAVGTTGGTGTSGARQLIELTDQFGRRINSTNYGNLQSGFEYDRSGRMTRRIGWNNDDKAIHYTYFNTGNLESIRTNVAQHPDTVYGDDFELPETVTSYRYDSRSNI
ncbi:hypothetical protein RMQ97_15480, partial [Maricaulis sp. D1M11]|uniref:hypothetical protein n=1 Tax=Maricaulis sp. D1M11 TaxID=3076117 RepID=UPI0039B3F87A